MLQDISESEMEMPSAKQLHLKYLMKLNSELRIQIQQRGEWKIDGPDKPARIPLTHQELAYACQILLVEKADIRATSHGAHETFMVLDERGAVKGGSKGGGAGPPRPSGGGPM